MVAHARQHTANDHNNNHDSNNHLSKGGVGLCGVKRLTGPARLGRGPGCECLLPFEYGPDVLKDLKPNRFTYTSCIDIQSPHGGAWCAVRGQCGTRSHNPDAHNGLPHLPSLPLRAARPARSDA